ncbi:hypothetical protein R1sor_013741 [Riccia sorocarpa]|uniref:RNA polymerase II transcription factor SIII subunit A n=1 Tax=Riccia sorocarpa TaxID=122646 RepID=A0ABD3HAD8_9MARC
MSMTTSCRDPSKGGKYVHEYVVARRPYTHSASSSPLLEQSFLLLGIQNLDQLGDIGHIDVSLLKVILPYCSPEQLLKVEESKKEIDLTPITNELWLHHYSHRFGEESARAAQERLTKETFKWRALYQAKVCEEKNTEVKGVQRLRELYKQAYEKNISRKLQRIEVTVVTPQEKKRIHGSIGGVGFSGRFGGGTSSRFSKPKNIRCGKGRLMKKARAEFDASIRAENRNQASKLHK